MKIYDLILGLISIVCLFFIISNKSTLAAIILLTVASMRLGIIIGEKKNGKH